MVKRAIVASLAIVVVCLVVGAPASHAQETGIKSRLASADLPLPRGIMFTVYNQRQDYDIERLEVQFPGFDIGAAEGLKVDNDTRSIHVVLDYWVLPFLNLFGIVGDIDGTTAVDLSEVDLGFPIALNDITVNYEGTVYGAGATLAGGWDDYFATVTYHYTNTDLDVATSEVKAWLVTPKLGYRVKGGAMWLGAMYQDAQEKHRGSYTLPFVGDLPFDVELTEGASLNYLVGGTVGIKKHWVVVVEAGFGKRDSGMVQLQYRF